jgi:hypothetical protein
MAFVDRSKVVLGDGAFGTITGQADGNTTKACPQSFYW